MGTDPSKHKLTMKDYLTLPIMEIVNYPDFDEKMFWIAMKLWMAPMSELAFQVDGEWVNSLSA